VDRGRIVPLDNHCREYLPIFSRDVLARIKGGDTTWETMVPPGVAKVIKEKGFFDYRAATGNGAALAV
jgi:hypothetical protein